MRKRIFLKISVSFKKWHRLHQWDLPGGVFYGFRHCFVQFTRTGTLDLSVFKQRKYIGLALLITLATAINERNLDRGFMYWNVSEESHNPYISSFNTKHLLTSYTILFLPFPGLKALCYSFLATDFILSLINCFIYIDRKSLIAPILIHALYTMQQFCSIYIVIRIKFWKEFLYQRQPVVSFCWIVKISLAKLPAKQFFYRLRRNSISPRKCFQNMLLVNY